MTTTQPPAEPATQGLPDVLRTAAKGCYQLRTNGWGTYLQAIPDPDANVEITDQQLKGFELRDDIHRIPAHLWSRWIKLCFHFTKETSGNLEVSCRLLRSEADRSIYRIVIPPQEVGGASVHARDFDGAIDIETGEVMEHWPPEGWIPIGSSHSHNTMTAFFSGTDDQYELGDPGLHVVVGSISLIKQTYHVQASVTASGRRFLIPFDRVIDTESLNLDFHPSVLDIVQVHQPRAGVYCSSGDDDSYRNWSKQWQEHYSNPANQTKDQTSSSIVRVGSQDLDIPDDILENIAWDVEQWGESIARDIRAYQRETPGAGQHFLALMIQHLQDMQDKADSNSTAAKTADTNDIAV